MSAVGAGPPTAQPRDPLAVVRGRGYPVLLLLAAVLGAPVAAVAFGFLALTDKLQSWTYTDLPRALGFHGTPSWWPLPLLALAGLLTALTIRHLPGTAGHRPTAGLSAKGAPAVRDLPGVVLAALASLGLGAVLGPEAPLIALGAGLGAAAVRLVVRDAPPNVAASMGAAGSFAAISTLLGSPLLGAFLLMEASGLGGALLDVVLVPGLLASGIGALMFTGLGSWTGLGTYSLTLNDVPHAHAPTANEFGWALVTGVAAACLGTGIKRLGVLLEARIAPRAVRGSVLAGLAVGGLALAYAEGSGRAASSAVLRPERAGSPAGRQRPVLGRHPPAAAGVQGTRLRGVHELLPGRHGLPVHVRGRGGRHRAVPLPRTVPGAGVRHGHRRHVRGHSPAPPDVRAPGHAAHGERRPDGHAAGHHGGGGRLRHLPAPGAGGRGALGGRRGQWWKLTRSASRGCPCRGA